MGKLRKGEKACPECGAHPMEPYAPKMKDGKFQNFYLYRCPCGFREK